MTTVSLTKKTVSESQKLIRYKFFPKFCRAAPKFTDIPLKACKKLDFGGHTLNSQQEKV